MRARASEWSVGGGVNIVADGRQRAYDGNIQRVRAKVEAEYGNEMKNAGFWQAVLLQLTVEWETQKRMKKIAPSDGLY